MEELSTVNSSNNIAEKRTGMNKKGFTLIETLLAMAVILIAIFVFTPIFAMSFKNITEAGSWQNIIIKQRAQIEEQQADRNAILSDDEKEINYVNLFLKDSANTTTSVIIGGKILSDTLGNRSYIKSFISDIYPEESLDGTIPDNGNLDDKALKVSPQTIYYGEILRGKTFTLLADNLTFIEDSVNKIKIFGKNATDILIYFQITYNSENNTLKLLVKDTAPDNFYLMAPFVITYNNLYTAQITALMPPIMAVTDKGNFITGYVNGTQTIFTEAGNVVSNAPVNNIIYNSQKSEYIAVGNTNLFTVFGKSFAWDNKNTTQFSSVNNNYGVAVDWLNNYMIGSSYNATVDNKTVEVFLSEKDSKYIFKSVFTAQTSNANRDVQLIDAEWFDLLRTTLFVSTYNSADNIIEEESSARNYVLALGNYGVIIKDGGTTSRTDYDLLYASENGGQWSDISAVSSPSNTSVNGLKINAVASGVGTFNQIDADNENIKSVDYSILIACTAMGKLYGVTPQNAVDPMLLPNATNWSLINHTIQITSFSSIVYGNNKFVAVGAGTNNIVIGTVNSNISTSPTTNFGINITWTGKNISGVTFTKVRYFGNKFYAVGSEDSYGVIYSSTDAITWTKIYKSATVCKITSIAGK